MSQKNECQASPAIFPFRNCLDIRSEALVSPLPGDSREATGGRAALHHAFSRLMKDVVLGRAYPPPLRGTSLEREDSINPNNLSIQNPKSKIQNAPPPPLPRAERRRWRPSRWRRRRRGGRRRRRAAGRARRGPSAAARRCPCRG